MIYSRKEHKRTAKQKTQGTVPCAVPNQMGDVIGITDNQGNELVQYEYDEWGITSEVTSVHNTSAERSLGYLNPLRYRGYYYDSETGFYYLQSRYYDPVIGRFISPDAPEYVQMQKDDYAGINSFLYCCNDPVNNVDYEGLFKKEYHKDQTLRIVLGFVYTIRFKYNNFSSKANLDRLANNTAQGCYDVDIKYNSTKYAYDKYCQSFHFNVNSYKKNGSDSRMSRYRELYSKAMNNLDSAKRNYNKNKTVCFNYICKAFYYFGMCLHPRQDIISHSGKGGNLYYMSNEVDAEGNKIPLYYYHLSGYDNPNWKYLNTNKTKADMFYSITKELVLKFINDISKKGLSK